MPTLSSHSWAEPYDAVEYKPRARGARRSWPA